MKKQSISTDSISKKERLNQLLMERCQTMKQFDLSFGYDLSLVAGVDEAGRGPLAGPVVAAAVIMPLSANILGIDDSKKTKEAERQRLYDEIIESCIGYGIGMVWQDEIDQINILEATKKAMALALNAIKPSVVLIDAVPLLGLSVPAHGIVKGDEQSYAIAAASILAKVTRDRIMIELDRVYPEYQFAKHKGYGTALHYKALNAYGPSPIHRRTFLRKWRDQIASDGD